MKVFKFLTGGGKFFLVCFVILAAFLTGCPDDNTDGTRTPALGEITFDPPHGEYMSARYVTISVTPSEAQIYYRIENAFDAISDVLPNITYDGNPIFVEIGKRLAAYAVLGDMKTPVVTATYSQGYPTL